MPEKPDMACVPFPKKTTYYLLTIPFLVMNFIVIGYLWTINIILALIIPALYFLACFCQSYCCAHQDCPYVGGWCPGIGGIIPASYLAKLRYGKSIKKSNTKFALYGTIGFSCIFLVLVFSLYWIVRLSLWLAIGYLVLSMAYYLCFFLTVCPGCAIRDICPGGKCQQLAYKNKVDISG